MKAKIFSIKANKLEFKQIKTEDLFSMYKGNRDESIRNELIERHLFIAEILSKKYINRGIEYDDIFQIACVGLIYAVDRYDIEKGYEFSSFATPTIIGEIKKYFRDKGWVVRVPRRIQEFSKKINNTKIVLSQKLQRTPTVDDIAEYLNCTSEEVLEAMETSKMYAPKSLDVTIDSNGDDKDMILSQLIGKDDKYFNKIENKDFIIKSIDKLNEEEKRVLRDRYFKRKTQIEIANEMKVSQMTVSRIEKRIIKKFRAEWDMSNSD